MNPPVVPQKTDEPKNMDELVFRLLCQQGGKDYALSIMRIVNGIRRAREMKSMQS